MALITIFKATLDIEGFSYYSVDISKIDVNLYKLQYEANGNIEEEIICSSLKLLRKRAIEIISEYG